MALGSNPAYGDFFSATIALSFHRDSVRRDELRSCVWQRVGGARPSLLGRGARSRGLSSQEERLCLEADRPVRLNNPQGLCEGFFQLGLP